MKPVAMLAVPLYRSRPADGDKVFGEAEGTVGDQMAAIELTTRGLYLGVIGVGGNGPSFGVDLNALAKAMADAAETWLKSSEGKF
ncbi:hypothetical protein OEZ60_20505 [Defluviimonas sp. WL0024]|uniref:Uncharacterized protein n=1 Tax=Albidovulum salinarum TaxID=2984153 RepID=A0ABT2X9S2_9RHOB|nr:hypothetical protein [Defluviimonas sp. WL0024]MCU9850370.1 hypothetical protein [Defluviimonas sp. WL0024]